MHRNDSKKTGRLTMTIKQADRVIKSGELIMVRWPKFDSEGIIRIVRRDRYDIYTDTGAIFDRGDTEFISVYPTN